MLISKNHLKARYTASTDRTRPVLNAIKITVEKDEVVAVATDGYILSEIRESMQDIEDFPNIDGSTDAKETLLQSSTADAVAKAIKKHKHLPILSYAHVGSDGVTVTDLEHTQNFNDHPIEGSFPDYKQLIPNTDEAKVVVTVNPKLLVQLLKIFKDEQSITLEVHDKLKPVVFRNEGSEHDIMGVLMPLKS
ncbi:hypothetical protein [Mycolicibacterium wolinskyi]|uniref:hypothetical protein n=1 Tax=Mycolicibacterium wolinskyi TaxID=59750 RepID=UPI00391786D1